MNSIYTLPTRRYNVLVHIIVLSSFLTLNLILYIKLFTFLIKHPLYDAIVVHNFQVKMYLYNKS